MLGVEAASSVLVDRLKADLPARLVALEARLGPVDLDPPALVGPAERDRLEPDQWPAVLVVAQDEGAVRMVDIVEGAAVYEVRYRMRIFGHVRGVAYESTSAARYRLSLAIREALFAAPVLGPDHVIDSGGWAVSYSEVAGASKTKRVVAASWLEVMVLAEESVVLDPLAVATTTVLTTQIGHPAL